MSPLGQAALEYAQSGWQVIPCSPRGKKPLVRGGFKAATTNEAQIREWWAQWPDANIGSPTGIRFDVLDLDGPTAEAAVNVLGEIPATLEARTGNGKHLYFAANPRVRCTAGRIAPKVDVRGSGGYVILPPSIHPSGAVYQWANGSPSNWPDLPAWPVELLAIAKGEKGKHKSKPTQHHGDKIQEGGRNSHLASLAGALRRKGSRPAVVALTLHGENESRCDSPLPHDEVERIAQSVSRYKPANAGKLGAARTGDVLIEAHHTDQGNAERLKAFAGDRLRYCFGFRAWLVWDGSRWKRAESGEEMGIAKELTLRLHELTPGLSDSVREKHARHALGLESLQRQRAMLESSRDLLAVNVADLDANLNLLNLPNGTLDLNTGSLREARREDFITQQARVAYDPRATCPTWDAALNTIFAGNGAMITFFRRCVGYSITGLTSEQCLFICHGDGANGKTTLLETILWLLGDYACKASADTFLSRKNDGGPSENLAVLRGARFAPAVEPDAGRALAESVLKEATGGDTMRVRRLYKRSWQFTPTFKLWLACNRLPRVRGTDHGIWRRLVTVPLMVKIPEAQRDRDLLGKLKSEASGILNWCLDGLADYGQRGLAPPEAVVKDREAYRSNEDQLAGWLAECCVTVETARCPTKDLRQSYETWCGEAGEAPLGSKAWRDELRRRGFQTVKMHGYPTYSGVGLVAQDASPPSRSGT